MTGIGSRYVAELVQRKYGELADGWLDAPHPDIYSDDKLHGETPRQLIESGCPACIDKVARLLEAG